VSAISSASISWVRRRPGPPRPAIADDFIQAIGHVVDRVTELSEFILANDDISTPRIASEYRHGHIAEPGGRDLMDRDSAATSIATTTLIRTPAVTSQRLHSLRHVPHRWWPG